jgi:small-conductance mechanosensitive channel
MRGLAIKLVAAALLLFGLPSAFADVGAKSPESRTEMQAGASVTLGDHTLFRIHESVKDFSPADRAEGITERVKRLAEDRSFRPDSFRVIDSDLPTTDIVVEERVIASVTDRDAQAEGRTRHELAQEYAQRLRRAVEQYREEYGFRPLMFAVLYAAFATAIFLGLLRLFLTLFRRANALFLAWADARVKALALPALEAAHKERALALLGAVLRFCRIVVVVVLTYVYLQLLLGLLPWTRPFANRLLGYIVAPINAIGEALWKHTPKLFFIAAIVLIARYALKVIRFFFDGVEIGRITVAGFYPDWAQPTYKIVRVLLIAFAVVVAFPYIPGSSSPAFQGVSIFMGLLFSLGSQSAVANIVAGVLMTYRRAFRVGDWVRIGDVMGDVTQIRLQVTHIRTPKNEEIVLPNSAILGSNVTNYSIEARGKGLILHTTVTIGYGSPWRQVHDLLVSAALATVHILKEPAPFVLQTALDDFYVTYELNAYTDIPHLMPQIYSDLHQNIQDKFNEAGVEIMSPHYTQIRDGHQVTIPEAYLPKDYVPSALRITTTASRKGSDPEGKEEASK